MKPRPICCGKKRSCSAVEWREGYDGGVWKCKPGRGCNKKEEFNKPNNKINERNTKTREHGANSN